MGETGFTSLRAFALWWWDNTPVEPPAEPAKVTARSFEFVLYRAGQYQAQLVCLYPGADVPAHAHPHVETYEAHYSHGGAAWMGSEDRPLPPPLLSGPLLPRRLWIAPGVLHGGRADVLTSALSLQRWRGREPTFISDDWDGAEPWT